MRYFLMRFDRKTLKPDLTPYDDPEEAFDALNAAERSREPHVEVVLLGAESEESLRVTHSSYFTHHLPRVEPGSVDLTNLPKVAKLMEQQAVRT